MMVSSPSAQSQGFQYLWHRQSQSGASHVLPKPQQLVGLAQSFHSPWKSQSLYSPRGEVVAEQRIQGTNPHHTKNKINKINGP